MLQMTTADASRRASTEPRLRASDAAPPITLLAPPSLLAWLQPALHGIASLVVTSVTPQTGTYWQFETDGGVPVKLPDTATRAWERPPFWLLIRLVPTTVGQSRNRFQVQEAVIGTRLGLADLQAKIVQTMVTLLKAAKHGHARSPLTAAGPRGLTHGTRRNTGFIGGALRRAAHRMGEYTLVDEWAIGLVHQQAKTLLAGESLQPARWLPRKPGVNLADPHPRPGLNEILCEEFGVGPTPPAARGRIVCLQLDHQDATITGSRVILAGDAHRSYPGTVQCGDDVVFLPETPDRGGTALYFLRADDRVEKLCGLGLQLRMGDPTLFKHEGRFWIAYTDLDIGEHDNLCLLHAPSLSGPWTPHQANPVKLDIRSSRPAGPVIVSAGRLYRPAQNCAASYGASITINRIEQLTPERFSEVAVREIRPAARGPYPHGLHTIAVRGDSCLIDGKRRRFRSAIMIGKLRRRLGPTREAAGTTPRDRAGNTPVATGIAA